MFPKLFSQTLSNICTPDPSYIPDAKERSQAAYKIMVQVYIYILTIFALVIQMLAGIFPISLQVVRILCFSILLISLLIFCRTRLYIYYIILTLSVSLFPMHSAYTREVLIPTGSVFSSTVIVYIVTDKWYYYVVTSMLHLANLIFLIRPNMAMIITSMTPQEFSEKFVVAVSAQLCLMMAFLAPLHVTMRNRYSELKESKVEVEGALSHYKTFLFSFSHEIRNPINILLGSIELALQENLPKFALEMIETAKISGELLLQLINNVLDVGKAEVGKLEIVPTATRIHDLVVRMWNISSELMKKKGLCGYLKISRELPLTIEIDPDRLNQVLLNLIGNAVKFTTRGFVNLSISWLTDEKDVSDSCFEPKPFEEEDIDLDSTDEKLFERNEHFTTLGSSYGRDVGELSDSYILTHLQKTNNIREKIKAGAQDDARNIYPRRNGVLKITVTDQGCGMNKEAMKGLFKKFYQCSTEASQRKRGTGLGLYITKDICESMKGEIRVYSKESVGSVFMACIPSQEVENQY